ncbi:MAG: class I SAM-dependent methyltransferase [Ignavibacterium sp.]
MRNNNFANYSIYYNLLYKDKDYEAETEYVYKKIKNYLPNIAEILELGMGTGTHAHLLQKKGIKVIGIELSTSMAQQARDKGLECYVNDCSEFKLNEKFGAIISLFHVISYITDNDRLCKTFNNVFEHLKPGGIFLFDVWYSPAVYNLKPVTRIKRIENNEFKLTRLAEPVINYNENIVDVNYEVIIENKKDGIVTNFNEVHPMRHFSMPEINLIANFNGFEVLETVEWMTDNKPSENTWGVCFLLKRN